MIPTRQQMDILNSLIHENGNIAVLARAGCGKTTLIRMGVDSLAQNDPRSEIVVCAFNKAIADEVGDKLRRDGHTDWKKVQCATLHSLGFSLLRFAFKPKVVEKKVQQLVRSLNNPFAENYEAQITSLVRMAKQSGVGFFDDMAIGDPSVWYRIADHYNINGLDETTHIDEIVACAQQVYRRSLSQTDEVDFDDMILMPLVKNLRVGFPKDYVFLDEAQDLSRSRQALARKFLKATGRMIIVGDDRQAIYGFSGADAAAMPRLIEEQNAKVMPLSITWRCPRAIVEIAQQYVSDITAAPQAPEGTVSHVTEMPQDLEPGRDAILCRNTAPLISLAYQLIKVGVPCKVEGRQIGEGLTKLARRWKVKTIEALLKRLEDYREREVQKAQAKENDRKAQEVGDKVDTLLEVCDACLQQGRDRVEDVVAFIDDLFADGVGDVVTLATYHRAKGREWERVYLFEHNTRCPSRMARKDWELEQEDNLAYVAITRSLDTLIFVEPE